MNNSRLLKEWLDAQGNKINLSNTSTNQASTAATIADRARPWDNFVNEFTKYLNAHGKYTIDHYRGGTSALLDIIELNSDGSSGMFCEFFFKITTGKFKITIGDHPTESGKTADEGIGFNELLDAIKDLNCPWFSGFDFDSLRESLNEWVDAKGDYKVLLESDAASLTSGFKLYENLWD